MIEIRVACSPGEARIAVIDGETLEDFALWRLGRPDGYGDFHAVRVTAPMDAMNGAFVVLADGSEGFLTGRHKEGALVTARVSRSAQGGKGLRLRPVDGVPPHHPALLARGLTPLEVISDAYPDAEILIDDPAIAAMTPTSLRSRVRRVLSAFDPVTEALCDALSDPTAELNGGLRATFTPTPALVAIDLDNPMPDARRLRPVAQVAANIAAVPSLCREIRIRNLSGAIVIDPAGIIPRKRSALLPAMQDALRSDPQSPQVLGITGLGLIEVVRPRGRAPLHELLRSPHGIALAALRTMLARKPERVTRPPTLRAAIPVIRALESDPLALEAFTLAYGTALTLDIELDFPLTFWSQD